MTQAKFDSEIDVGAAAANQQHSQRVLFVSDPLCSWCWGMANEIQLVREQLGGEIGFGLLLGGIGLGNTAPMAPEGWDRFRSLWGRVTATTGQKFRDLGESPSSVSDSASGSGSDPAAGTALANFVYNSREACRAVLAASVVAPDLALDYLHALQRAFFVDALPCTDLEVQCQEAENLGIASQEFTAMLKRISDPELESFLQKSKGHGSAALPSVLVETAPGEKKLIAGGYVTAEYLVGDLQNWLN